MSDDPMLCYCFGTTRDRVRRHFSVPGATLEALIAETGITTKCTACALDLDMLLDDVQRTTRLDRARGTSEGSLQKGLRQIVERVDSGFLVNRDGITTRVRLANYPPNFDGDEFCAAHRFTLRLYANDGRACGKRTGRLGANAEVTVDLGEIPGCPADGWFLLQLTPDDRGYYGTLRPQVVLDGGRWIACYHTQFHRDASRDGRRAGAPIFAKAGRCRTVISVINGSARATGLVATMESAAGAEERRWELPGNGARLLDLDEAFGNIPDEGAATLRIRSDQPTRKNLINVHPDGSWGVDHFPNLV